jgi:hypothetical protein
MLTDCFSQHSSTPSLHRLHPIPQTDSPSGPGSLLMTKGTGIPKTHDMVLGSLRGIRLTQRGASFMNAQSFRSLLFPKRVSSTFANCFRNFTCMAGKARSSKVALIFIRMQSETAATVAARDCPLR